MTLQGSGSPGKLAYVVTEDWYFWSHRLPTARAAQALGYEIVLVTRARDFAERIRSSGIEVIDWPLKRGGLNFWSELMSVAALYTALRAARPTVVHNVALKPVLYGTIAAKLVGVPVIINSITGLGFVFSSRKTVARIVAPVVLFVLHCLARLPRVLTICQNMDDADLIFRGGMQEGKLCLIKGSGVDPERFPVFPEPSGSPVAAFVGRMLREKGVGDLVEAAAILKHRGTDLRVILVGPVDRQSPGAISEDVLLSWQRDGLVDWIGSQDDIAAIWHQSHIAVLPSFREGLPKAIIEAAACGRAVVTTDVPGCRDAVEDEITGLLVPPHEPGALADALHRLACSPDMRTRMGAAGRAKVMREFADEIVIKRMSAVYSDVLRWIPSKKNTSAMRRS